MFPAALTVLAVRAQGLRVQGHVDLRRGRGRGRSDQREGENCKAVLALLDAKVETALAVISLTDATETCAVPVLVAPVDIDGDGNQDALVHGQLGDKGFRAWFQIQDRALVAGPHERWDGIP